MYHPVLSRMKSASSSIYTKLKRTKIEKIFPGSNRNLASASSSSSSILDNHDYNNETNDRSAYLFKHFNPTDEHSQLRQMVKTFVEREVSPN